MVSGQIVFQGKDVLRLSERSMHHVRGRRILMIPQDPLTALNPRQTIAGIITEPLRIHGMSSKRERLARAQELLGLVGVAANALERYPHEFSGGQRQRIGIARALASNPAFVVLDEPVSALDVSIQSQILHLLLDLQQQFGLTYLFRQPIHPYTQALLSAVPYPDPEIERTHQRIILHGEVPSPVHPPSGCRFHTRCPIASDRCRTEVPALRRLASGHDVACHYAESSQAKMAAAVPAGVLSLP